MLQRLRAFLGVDKDGSDWDEIWIERLTHEGGWVRQYPNTVFDEPPDRPESDNDPWLTWKGRFRAITREDNQYGEILWEYETANADEHYAEQREKARQRELLMAMSIEEVEEEYFEGPNRLDALDTSEIRERYDELGEK